MNANFFELKGLRIKQIEGAAAGEDDVRIATDAMAEYIASGPDVQKWTQAKEAR